MLDHIDQTIVAISSAPGRSAVGIVRLSGGDAIGVVDRMADVAPALSRRAGSTQVEGRVRIGEDGAVPARFYLFRAPRSYTREDVVEIHTIGGPVLLEMIRRAAIALGAVPAPPGAFTARALIHGALDASQAEAVGRVIGAHSDAQLRAARRMLDGSFGRRIEGLRARLAELVALVEADIDFAEEPIEFITPEDLRARVSQIENELAEMRRRAVSSERVSALPHILLLGPPNAGKSTLVNALSSTRRAICAAVAGTTRDLLAAPIRLGHRLEAGATRPAGATRAVGATRVIEAVLLDSAGVDQSQDEILAQARALALDAAQRVDLVCIVLDASPSPVGNRCHTQPPVGNRWRSDEEAFIRRVRALDLPAVVVAANKCDRVPGRGTGFDPLIDGESIEARLRGALDIPADWPICPISALNGTGLNGLRTTLADRIGGAATHVGAEALVLGERQRAGIDDALATLRRAAELAAGADQTIDSADVIAFELRESLEALGTLTGAVTTEDLLTNIFANFCIGK